MNRYKAKLLLLPGVVARLICVSLSISLIYQGDAFDNSKSSQLIAKSLSNYPHRSRTSYYSFCNKKRTTMKQNTGNNNKSSEHAASFSVGFIGAGMMASALVDGLVAKGVVSSPSSVIVSDVWEPARRELEKKGMIAVPTNGEVCQQARDVVVLAVKPNCIEGACRDVSRVQSEALVVSIAAGITLDTLEEALPGRRVVRVMPNTPCLVGEAACGFSSGKMATEQDRETVKWMFGAVGIALEVDEKMLDAVTGLSGSGPAYVFQFIEALSDGGVRSGLPRLVATKLAAQTVKGAAEMVLKTETHPGLLKDGVTSPGGTTIAGVEALERGGFRSATISAVMAATKRSMQVAGVSSEDIESKYGL